MTSKILQSQNLLSKAQSIFSSLGLNKVQLFLSLLTLDLVTKIVAFLVQPKNDVFFLVFNKNMVFGIEASDWIKFGLPLMILPLFATMGMFLKREQKMVYFQIVLAGFLGNYLSRFSSLGVIDFLRIGNVNANLADLYCWGSYLYFVYCVIVIPMMNKNPQKGF